MGRLSDLRRVFGSLPNLSCSQLWLAFLYIGFPPRITPSPP
jgi:hypothetical protein